MRKNPHAVALGRKGGQANTEAQRKARRLNGLNGGRRRKYRIQAGELQKLISDDRWWPLTPPYDRAAREALRRLEARPTLHRTA